MTDAAAGKRQLSRDEPGECVDGSGDALRLTAIAYIDQQYISHHR